MHVAKRQSAETFPGTCAILSLSEMQKFFFSTLLVAKIILFVLVLVAKTFSLHLSYYCRDFECLVEFQTLVMNEIQNQTVQFC